VPGFGDSERASADRSLRRGPNGSNRTGRPFTGDGSGNFLYPSCTKRIRLQPNATHRDDGMRLLDLLTSQPLYAALRREKPSPEEIAACAPILIVNLPR